MAEKYTFREKMFENSLLEYWKVEAGEGEEAEAFLSLVFLETPENFLPKEGPSSKAPQVLTSLEKDSWIFSSHQGRPLSEYLKESSPLNTVKGLRIVQGLSSLLKTLKEEDNLPPGLAPEMIWVDEKDLLKILDLSLLDQVFRLQLDHFRSAQGAERNGLFYFPPEWKEGEVEKIEEGLVYSVGMLSYRLLTGNLPSENSTPSQLNVDLPEQFDGVFKKAIAENPQNRCKTLEEFSSSFESSLELSGLSLEEEDLSKILMVVFGLLVVLLALFYFSSGKKEGGEKEKGNPAYQLALKRIIKEREEYLRDKGENHKNMVLIPAGKFILGRNPNQGLPKEKLSQKQKDSISDETPAREVYLKGYWIDKYEVTFKEYLIFAEYTAITQDHRFCHPEEGPSKNHFPKIGVASLSSKKKFPVAGIDWFDAYGFCRFMGMELPTEAQWEKAAKGTPKLWKKKFGKKAPPYPPLYPWGMESPKGKAMFREEKKKFHPVITYGLFDSFPEGKSIYGVYNLSGNVWEFVRDRYQKDFFKTLPPEAKDPFNSWETSKETLIRVVVKGGSYTSSPRSLRTTHRTGILPTLREVTGFRCVMAEEKKEEKKGEKK